MIQNPAIADWIPVPDPPGPYLFVLRRSFPNGLHVLVLTDKPTNKFQVWSSLDHGTTQGTQILEGTTTDPEELARLVSLACKKWNVLGVARPSSTSIKSKRYYYAKTGGGLSDPVSRDEMFRLAGTREVGWDSQVWEEVGGAAASGGWCPIMDSLGFPCKSGVIK